jgi:hypothetical protein
MISRGQITENRIQIAHMRSGFTYAGNNKNRVSGLSLNQKPLIMLFYRSNTNIREFIVIYVLNRTSK